jgi:hypothetical protein
VQVWAQDCEWAFGWSVRLNTVVKPGVREGRGSGFWPWHFPREGRHVGLDSGHGISLEMDVTWVWILDMAFP